MVLSLAVLIINLVLGYCESTEETEGDRHQVRCDGQGVLILTDHQADAYTGTARQ